MLLALKNTDDNERGPLGMLRILKAVHESSWHQPPIRFLCGSHDGKVGLFLDIPKSLSSLTSSQLHAEYPTLNIDRLDDSTFQSHRYSRVWCREIVLRPDIFPIDRYNQSLDVDRQFSDPIAAMLEAVGREKGITAFIEIIAKPAGCWRRWRAQRAAQRLARPDYRHEPEISRWYALGITHSFFGIRLLACFFSLIRRSPPKGMTTQEATTSSSHTHEREADAIAANQKVRSFLFETRLRLVVIGAKTEGNRAIAKLDQLQAVVSATANPAVAKFRVSSEYEADHWPPNCRTRRPFLFSAEELATLFHPDTQHVAAAGMARNESRKLEPPQNLPLARRSESKEQTLCLGRVLYRDRNDTFGIRNGPDKRRHIYVIGRTGMGKTTLLRNMIMDEIHGGRGLTLLEPHGDLATTIIRSIPRKHWDRLVIFDPADDAYPIAFNPLACTHGAKPEMVAQGLLSTFAYLYESVWGPRMESVFRNALMAAVDIPNATLLTAFQLLTDPQFAQRNISHMSNPLVRRYWETKVPQWNERLRQEAIEPVLNKLETFLTDPMLRRILGQPNNKLDLREIMDEGKILIVNLSKGNIGADNARLLGSLLVTRLQQDAMSRANVPEDKRRDFALYVDEFQNFSTPAFATILSEARKFRMSITMSHQFIDQLDRQTRQAVFGNVGTMIAFALGTEDAQLLAQQLGGKVTPDDIVHLPKYHAYIGLMIDGKTSDPFLMKTLKPSESLHSTKNLEALVHTSRTRYGTPAELIDDRLRKELLVAV